MEQLFSKVARWSVLLGLALVAGCTSGKATSSKARDGGTRPVDMAGQATGNCGSARQTCCMGSVCDEGLSCDSRSTCCGRALGPCLENADCCAGFGCNAGKCCLPAGSKCSTTNDCCAGLACTSGTCQKPGGAPGSMTCNGPGKPCCTGNTCTAGLVCEGGTCKACGGSGQACCGTSCSAGMRCSNGVCGIDCGSQGKKCCPGTPECLNGLTCNNGSCGATSSTGAAGQPCGSGGACDPGLVCVAMKCAVPPDCDAVGKPCCTGQTCKNGLSCVSGKCADSVSCIEIQDGCMTASQCCGPLVCESSLTDVAGEVKKTCCVQAGGGCPNGDLDCCGSLLCVNGRCACQDGGEVCLSDADCCSQNCDEAAGTCAGVSSGPGSETACTYYAGKGIGVTCDTSTECCDEYLCERRAYAFSSTCCSAAAGRCTEDKDCCGNMACDTSAKTCICQGQGSDCFTNSECCEGLACNSRGICATPGAGEGMGNVPLGGACAEASECVSDPTIACAGGACCWAEPRKDCVDSAQCCGDMRCDPNPSARQCCYSEGHACEWHFFGRSECCEGSCIGGKCTTSSSDPSTPFP